MYQLSNKKGLNEGVYVCYLYIFIQKKKKNMMLVYKLFTNTVCIT